ncbi:hypothetical protein D779_0070 [Imhoffiella purpurea]|uniref:Uncharacterized protein n=1 Tax=Imhoffiella purpurea TaxID=1249627 RepID=W9VCC5_9GAMM|nr:hypothetical protein D779_0070 [Imhoffiella purpurea]
MHGLACLNIRIEPQRREVRQGMASKGRIEAVGAAFIRRNRLRYCALRQMSPYSNPAGAA